MDQNSVYNLQVQNGLPPDSTTNLIGCRVIFLTNNNTGSTLSTKKRVLHNSGTLQTCDLVINCLLLCLNQWRATTKFKPQLSRFKVRALLPHTSYVWSFDLMCVMLQYLLQCLRILTLNDMSLSLKFQNFDEDRVLPL